MQIKNYLYDILNTFANYDLTVVPTTKNGDANNYLKNNCGNFDYVICSGGDGTLNEVVNGMMASKIEKLLPIGYIPAGSANDFASSTKIPKNMVKAAALAVNGLPSTFDIGKFNDKYFVYIAAFGAFTSVSYATPQDIKNTLGHFAYLIEGIKELGALKANRIKVTSKEFSSTDNFIYGMVTNTYTVGGMYKLDKKTVKLDDGLFEVMLVKEPKDLLELNQITTCLLDSKQKSNLVITFKTDDIKFETEEEVAWTLDGEYGGNSNTICIKNIAKAINIVNKP